ncbi:MAG: hypothetical protein KAU50_11770, partial [Candidatus Marinimicrobia bacterium]|nr:hypothetical protein [Candidatus Neomarinimicrobiota bacterium]
MIYVFEDQHVLDLEPLTLTWASFELRCGAFTHLERIQRLTADQPITLVVRPEMAAVVREKHPGMQVNPENIETGTWLNGAVLWDEEAFLSLKGEGAHLLRGSRLLGAQLEAEQGQIIYELIVAGKPVDLTSNVANEPKLLP